MALLDIDRIPEIDGACRRSSSYNRFNWASFDERDHFGDPARRCASAWRADAAAQGSRLPDGPIFLLTHLRYLGYNFNPISFFYCCDAAGERAEMVLAEVHNTFGETSQLLASAGNQRAERQRAALPLSQDDARVAVHGHGAGLRFRADAARRRLVAHMNTLGGERVASRRDADARAPAVDRRQLCGARWCGIRG